MEYLGFHTVLSIVTMGTPPGLDLSTLHFARMEIGIDWLVSDMGQQVVETHNLKLVVHKDHMKMVMNHSHMRL